LYSYVKRLPISQVHFVLYCSLSRDFMVLRICFLFQSVTIPIMCFYYLQFGRLFDIHLAWIWLHLVLLSDGGDWCQCSIFGLGRERETLEEANSRKQSSSELEFA